jgi:hypothetical protein
MVLGSIPLLPSIRAAASALRHLLHDRRVVSQHHSPNLVELFWPQPAEYACESGVEGGDASRDAELAQNEASEHLSGFTLIDFHYTLEYTAQGDLLASLHAKDHRVPGSHSQ